MLTFDRVSFDYGEAPVLNEVSFVLPEKGALCFAGPSGCGKTTLLRLIADLEKPKAGTLTRPDDLTVSMVFQENRLLPWLTVEENVALVCNEHARVRTALEAVSLWEERKKHPSELSGGMQRRVALARAMAYNGDILILDEPFTGLDEELCRSIAAALCRQFEDRLILLVTHSDTDPKLFNATLVPLFAPLQGTLF